MVTPLPCKFVLTKNQKPEDLVGGDLAAYEVRRDQEARRQDIAQTGVAQEALDVLDEINARHGSSSEVFIPWADGTQYGYSLRVLKAAIAERDRVAQELRVKPSAEVVSDILVVSDVMTRYGIDEYVKPIPIPE